MNTEESGEEEELEEFVERERNDENKTKLDKEMDMLEEERKQEGQDTNLRTNKKSAKDEEREDAEFPDEVNVPFDQPARVRFQKYRGLSRYFFFKLGVT